MHDIFAFSDIHGMYDLYKAIMNYCNEQDPEATIVFLGDACDRGPYGYKIIKELLNNPKIIYLKGNHEDLFVKAARQIKEEFVWENLNPEDIRKRLQYTKIFDYKYNDIKLHVYNGGIQTLIDWIMDGMPMEIIEQLDNLPYTFSGDKCDFCHAAGIYPIFKKANEQEYNNEPIDEYSAESLIWSRSAYEYGWAPNRIAIFGHTPTPYLLEDLEIKLPENIGTQPYKYIGTLKPEYTGAKIDMDTGAAFTKRAFVLNILTMKAQGFEDIENEIKKIECVQL